MFYVTLTYSTILQLLMQSVFYNILYDVLKYSNTFTVIFTLEESAIPKRPVMSYINF